MKVISSATKDEVYASWLRSEWFRLAAAYSGDATIVTSPDLTDGNQNRRRERILHDRRAPILDSLPPDLKWTRVELEDEDLPRTFMIVIWDWFLDTGGTFELLKTETHLRSGRGFRDSSGNHAIDHVAEVERKIQYIQQRHGLDEPLILVGSENALTIIDGTHRAAALLKINQPRPWPAFLGTSARIRECRWHFESDTASRHIQECQAYVRSGAIW